MAILVRAGPLCANSGVFSGQHGGVAESHARSAAQALQRQRCASQAALIGELFPL